MTLLLVAAALVPVAFQASIERTYVQTAARDVVHEVGGVTLSAGDFEALGRTSLEVEGGTPGRSEMISTEGTGFMEASFLLSFTAPVATTYSWSFRAPFASCGGGCNFGPFDWGAIQDGGFNRPVAAGETVTIARSAPFPSSMGFYVDPSSFRWMYAENGYSYDNGADSRVDWQTQLPVRVDTFEVVARSSMTIETTYRLFELPSAPYCTSQANSTGQTASIGAFGVPESGSEQFAVRVEGAAQGEPGVLFMGDGFGLNVGSTTTLCLSGSIQRVGGVQLVDAGEIVFDVDLTGWPAGQTAYFQSFFRDPQFGLSASEAISVAIQ